MNRNYLNCVVLKERTTQMQSNAYFSRNYIRDCSDVDTMESISEKISHSLVWFKCYPNQFLNSKHKHSLAPYSYIEINSSYILCATNKRKFSLSCLKKKKNTHTHTGHRVKEIDRKEWEKGHPKHSVTFVVVLARQSLLFVSWLGGWQLRYLNRYITIGMRQQWNAQWINIPYNLHFK